MKFLVHLCVGRFQSLTSPSKAPLAVSDSRVGCFPMQDTPSEWPSKQPMKGLANTRSNLVAFKARTYSLGASNGCNPGS